MTDKRRVQISEFKGMQMVGIREFYEKDGEMLPGKKVCRPPSFFPSPFPFLSASSPRPLLTSPLRFASLHTVSIPQNSALTTPRAFP